MERKIRYSFSVFLSSSAVYIREMKTFMKKNQIKGRNAPETAIISRTRATFYPLTVYVHRYEVYSLQLSIIAKDSRETCTRRRYFVKCQSEST